VLTNIVDGQDRIDHDEYFAMVQPLNSQFFGCFSYEQAVLVHLFFGDYELSIEIGEKMPMKYIDSLFVSLNQP
jgi:hypothetical protein